MGKFDDEIDLILAADGTWRQRFDQLVQICELYGDVVSAIQEDAKKVEEALRWYGEKAASLAKAAATEPTTHTERNIIDAIHAELIIDSGKRAVDVLKRS